jgi:hypothetical protein
LNADGKVPILEEGEENVTLVIRNDSHLTLNITMLDLQEDFSIVKTYPKKADYEG